MPLKLHDLPLDIILYCILPYIPYKNKRNLLNTCKLYYDVKNIIVIMLLHQIKHNI